MSEDSADSSEQQIWDHAEERRKGPWTADEDILLKQLVEENGACNWKHIAAAVRSRTAKSCRLRWYNQLCPDLKKEPFSQWEDALVVQAHNQYGNKWTIIAKMLPGRTDNSIKNHWNATLKRRVQGNRLHNRYLDCNLDLKWLLEHKEEDLPEIKDDDSASHCLKRERVEESPEQHDQQDETATVAPKRAKVDTFSSSASPTLISQQRSMGSEVSESTKIENPPQAMHLEPPMAARPGSSLSRASREPHSLPATHQASAPGDPACTAPGLHAGQQPPLHFAELAGQGRVQANGGSWHQPFPHSAMSEARRPLQRVFGQMSQPTLPTPPLRQRFPPASSPYILDGMVVGNGEPVHPLGGEPLHPLAAKMQLLRAQWEHVEGTSSGAQQSSCATPSPQIPEEFLATRRASLLASDLGPEQQQLLRNLMAECTAPETPWGSMGSRMEISPPPSRCASSCWERADADVLCGTPGFPGMPIRPQSRMQGHAAWLGHRPPSNFQFPASPTAAMAAAQHMLPRPPSRLQNPEQPQTPAWQGLLSRPPSRMYSQSPPIDSQLPPRPQSSLHDPSSSSMAHLGQHGIIRPPSSMQQGASSASAQAAAQWRARSPSLPQPEGGGLGEGLAALGRRHSVPPRPSSAQMLARPQLSSPMPLDGALHGRDRRMYELAAAHAECMALGGDQALAEPLDYSPVAPDACSPAPVLIHPLLEARERRISSDRHRSPSLSSAASGAKPPVSAPRSSGQPAMLGCMPTSALASCMPHDDLLNANVLYKPQPRWGSAHQLSNHPLARMASDPLALMGSAHELDGAGGWAGRFQDEARLGAALEKLAREPDNRSSSSFRQSFDQDPPRPGSAAGGGTSALHPAMSMPGMMADMGNGQSDMGAGRPPSRLYGMSPHSTGSFGDVAQALSGNWSDSVHSRGPPPPSQWVKAEADCGQQMAGNLDASDLELMLRAGTDSWALSARFMGGS